MFTTFRHPLTKLHIVNPLPNVTLNISTQSYADEYQSESISIDAEPIPMHTMTEGVGTNGSTSNGQYTQDVVPTSSSLAPSNDGLLHGNRTSSIRNLSDDPVQEEDLNHMSMSGVSRPATSAQLKDFYAHRYYVRQKSNVMPLAPEDRLEVRFYSWPSSATRLSEILDNIKPVIDSVPPGNYHELVDGNFFVQKVEQGQWQVWVYCAASETDTTAQ
ncbi:hypothetical protein CVT24_010229 [Panaeolus cyanescens]|uniref:Uncharacterized protein n=1 Tax=Panaeolus cyanescens TaxID=181874 RepID=A0A409YPR7_9AGAR|nr:hypothetical protein CVT24_010229 [Panaeolus cyanescens]